MKHRRVGYLVVFTWIVSFASALSCKHHKSESEIMARGQMPIDLSGNRLADWEEISLCSTSYAVTPIDKMSTDPTEDEAIKALQEVQARLTPCEINPDGSYEVALNPGVLLELPKVIVKITKIIDKTGRWIYRIVISRAGKLFSIDTLPLPKNAPKALVVERIAQAVNSEIDFRSGAAAISKSKNFNEAVAKLERAIEGTNPLSGTSRVGGGNCANDAITQITALALGRFACAIPYPDSQTGYREVPYLLKSIQDLFGLKNSIRVWNLGQHSNQQLVRELKNGEIAYLISYANNEAHATFITKIKDQLVHVNNQDWTKIRSVSEWEAEWRLRHQADMYQAVYFDIYRLSAKIIGFR